MKKGDQDQEDSFQYFRGMQQEKLMFILDASMDGIAILDKGEKFWYVNDAHASIYGYESSAEVMDVTWHKLYYTDELERFENYIMPLLRKDKRWRGEAVGKRKDGSTFPQELSLSIAANGDIICMVRDISERIERHNLLKEMDVARRTLMFKQNFLANMSHEMRTPLTGIIGMIDILENLLSDSSLQECLKDIKDSAALLSSMVERVLDFSKINQGDIRLHNEPFPITLVLNNIINLYRIQCEKKDIELLVHLGDNLPDSIISDKSKLAQILNILLSNALKYTNEGSISIKVGLRDKVKNPHRHVLKFEVTDTGIGIDQPFQLGIFEPFGHLHHNDTRAYDGTGLGLAMARQLVTLLGGEIGLNSTHGVGSTFWFTIAAPSVG